MNCLIVDDEEMSRTLVGHFVAQTEGLTLAHTCESAVEAANYLRKQDVDLVFLDVEMPEMSGLELLKVLPRKPEIVLITSKAEHAVEAFEYNVTDYLVKPVAYPRFLQAVARVQENLEARVAPDDLPHDIYVRTEQKIVKVNLADLLYVEALADYVMLHTVNNRYVTHSTMKGIEKKLTNKAFVRIHRSYIVNKDKIEVLEDLSVLINKKHLPIGASYKDAFLKRLNIL